MPNVQTNEAMPGFQRPFHQMQEQKWTFQSISIHKIYRQLVQFIVMEGLQAITMPYMKCSCLFSTFSLVQMLRTHMLMSKNYFVFLMMVLNDGTNIDTTYDVCRHMFSSQLVSCVLCFTIKIF